MNFVLLAILINFALGFTDYQYRLTSAIYKNGKMYIYEPEDSEVSGSGLYVYSLKDGTISDNKPNIINITRHCKMR